MASMIGKRPLGARMRGLAMILAATPAIAMAADNLPPYGALGRALFGDDFGAADDTRLGGWLELGAVIKKSAGQPSGLGNSPVVLARDRGLQLNQAYLYFEKGIRTNVIPRVTPIPAPVFQNYSVGFYADLLYGRDGQPIQMFGWDDKLGINKPGSDDPAKAAQDRQNFLVQPQAYVQAYMPWGLGMAVMAGNFMSPIGNEIGFHPQPGPNIFYTHSYSFESAPIKHTGALFAANLMKDDKAGMLAGEFGIVQGWSNAKDNNNKAAYLGALRYRTPGMDTWIDYEVISGDAQADASRLSSNDVPRSVNIPITRVVSPRGQNKTQQFVTVSHDWDENWHAQVGVHQGRQRGDGQADTIDIITGPGFSGATWSGVEARLKYTINNQWSVAGRMEQFRDPDGFALFPNTVAVKSNYNALTFGVQWRADKHILVRPEIRRDWQSNNNGAKAFNGGNDDKQTSINVDVVFYY